MELSIFSETIKAENVFINKNNNILVANYFTLYNLISELNKINTTKSNVILGNKSLTSKNAVCFNLLDYEKISEQLSFKKGSILYEFLMSILVGEISEKEQDINNYLEDFLITIKNSIDFSFDIEFEVESQKLISNFMCLNINDSINELVEKTVILLEKYIEKNPNKSVICLVNNHLFQDKLEKIENVYTFNFNNMREYNLLLTNTLDTYEHDLLVNHIKMNWPYDIESEEVSDLINIYNKNYLSKGEFLIKDFKIYIIGMLLNFHYQSNFQLLIEDKNIPENYLNFIISLQKK